MKLFSQNLEIIVPCCDVVIKLIQKFVYHVELAVRILETKTIITLVQNFFSAGRISFKRLCESCT